VNLLLAGLLGLALGWFLARSGALRRRGSPSPRQAQLLSWIEAAPSGWLLLDVHDDVHLINPQAERLLQCAGAIRPRVVPLAELCGAPELRELIHTARRRDWLQRLRWQLQGQELEALALPGADGWVALVLQSRRSLEAQLEQQERWVSDVAHELRTPLTALLLVGDSLAAQANPRSALLVERLQRELLRLQRLVADLLELSRLENTLPGGGGWLEEVDLRSLLEQVWSGLAPIAQERDVALRIESGEPVLLIGDSSRLHRALLNLLDNALRYAPRHSVITASLRREAGWCVLSVRDEGPGLGEEDLERLFERFYRGDPSRARHRGGGSGLGLSIVKQIAVAHRGRVRASNHPRGGAVIELLLPLAS
jgi:two-component system phosphate regulon sensor histidine kinase PhoR